MTTPVALLLLVVAYLVGVVVTTAVLTWRGLSDADKAFFALVWPVAIVGLLGFLPFHLAMRLGERIAWLVQEHRERRRYHATRSTHPTR